ncbi:MAG: LysR family transcriptional regulator [Lachnospiraceae bacterium]|nr:LysR family transcriptional regulator [Lachnospiraceae bacterium]
MDDRRIEVFLATVKNGSFSKAAEQLHCTQSAVTQVMNNFENEIGCKLLNRQHNGINLTPEGEALLPFIIDVDTSIKKLMSTAKEVSSAENTPIRIGTYSSVANTFLPTLMKNYQDVAKEALFDLHIGSEELNGWLINSEIDLLFADEVHAKGARWFPLMEDPYCAVVPDALMKEEWKDYITQEDFFALPFIMSANNNLDSVLENLPKNSLSVVCDDDSTLVNMVSRGLGATLLPKLSIYSVPDNVKVLPIKPEVYRTIGLATPNKFGGKVRKFVDFVLDSFSEEK